MIIPLFGVYSFRVGLMTLTLFQGHGCVREIDCKFCFLDSSLGTLHDYNLVRVYIFGVGLMTLTFFKVTGVLKIYSGNCAF